VCLFLYVCVCMCVCEVKDELRRTHERRLRYVGLRLYAECVDTYYGEGRINHIFGNECVLCRLSFYAGGIVAYALAFALALKNLSTKPAH